MPRARVPLEVVMVPLTNKRVINPPSFPPFQRLYLELMENKDKIKKEFLKQEFIPKYDDEIIFDEDGDIREPPKKGEKKEEKKPPQKKEPSREEKRKLKEEPPKEKASKEEKKKGEAPQEETPQEETPKEESHDDILHDDITQDKKGEDPLDAFLKKSRSIGSRKNTPTDKKKKSYQDKKDDILKDETVKKIPPSLQDLEDGGAFDTGGIKDMNRISRREQDQEEKVRAYLFKYDLLRKSYPNEEIPKFTINADPDHIAKTYDDILRNLSVGDNINKYRKYLIYGFYGTEALVGNVLGFDMTGFTKQQIIDMSSYEKLLIEIGEKQYTPKSNWPVELRLLGLIIINAAFFVAGRLAFKASGLDILGQLNNSASAGVQAANAVRNRKTQKMAGPTIDLNDIPSAEPPKEGVQFVSK